MPRKNSKLIYLVALLLFLGGVGYLTISSLLDNSVCWVAVSEALAMPAENPQPARLFGDVKDTGSAQPDGVSLHFQIMDRDDNTKTMWVTYKGSVPDMFMVGAKVIIDGTYYGPNQDFVAEKLITQCPAKYEEKLGDKK